MSRVRGGGEVHGHSVGRGGWRSWTDSDYLNLVVKTGGHTPIVTSPIDCQRSWQHQTLHCQHGL